MSTAWLLGGERRLGRALAAALAPDVDVSSERGDVVVDLRPLIPGARLDDAIVRDVDGVLEAAALGKPLIVASRLSAIGRKSGLIAEDVLSSPFGDSSVRAGELDIDDELASCRAAIAHVQTSARFADQRSKITADAKRALRDLGGATTGSALQRAVERGLEKLETELYEKALVERAAGWRFETGSGYALRGYTSALGEVALLRRGPLTIVRLPELLDDDSGSVRALLDRVHDGTLRFPIPARARLEAMPVDDVAASLALVVRAVLSAQQGFGVIHVATSDKSPLDGARLLDLIDLHLRRVRRRADDAPRAAAVLSVDRRATLPPVLDEGRALLGRGLALFDGLIDKKKLGQLADVVDETVASVRGVLEGSPQDGVRFGCAPFFDESVRFSLRPLRMCAARAGKAGVALPSERIDWRRALLEDALPTLDENRRSLERARKDEPRPAYDSLAHLVVEIAERYRSAPALSRFEGDEIVDVTYTELLERARAVALRLERAGVTPGDRVILAGLNHPAWGICAFGVMLARATLVPLDANLEEDVVRNIVRKARPRLAIVDKHVRDKAGAALPQPLLDMQLTAVDGPGIPHDRPLPVSDELASILFTSGTTGEPKGVMLTHRNFCSLLASLQTIFPTGQDDRMLSVLPLHHTFEFSCGLLMPLASGARIYTPDALTGERVLFGLKKGRITAIVGVPALWQLLERRIAKQAAERGDTIQGVLETLLKANRALGKRTGLSFGKVALKPIHDELGGHLRTLISGGSALPPAVHDMFQGLGLPLAEGYGLTEAAPVLTVAEGAVGAPAGTVGRPIPGVELRIVDADPNTKVGEVWARAPNVMRGYFEDDAATRGALDGDWLKTGDLGFIDAEGRLRLVGRSKDVVVTASGENVYLDDVEKKLEDIPGVSELTLLGLNDPRGGERLALAYVVSATDEAKHAVENLKQRILRLPGFARPAVVEQVEGPLPRTATRKVKRKEVRKTLEGILVAKASSSTNAESDTPMSAVRAAVASVAGVDVRKLTGQTRLPQDLGFDSLMWVELGGMLEKVAGKIEPEKLVEAESVAQLEALVRARASRGDDPVADPFIDDERPTMSKASGLDPLELVLPVVKPLGRAALTTVQRDIYRTLFKAAVTGRANIPYNKPSIVIANHASHLDTGLVKFALGRYGRDLRPLAAKDYFFEGSKLKVAFFEHFTNLVPIDRETGSGLAFEQAKAVVEQGHTALIFPEGTRREDGKLGPFKPLVARLSLATNVDVLPIWMKGNYDALPRGRLLPNLNARDLEAHIGPPLEVDEMKRLTAGMPNVRAARAATEIIRKAVVALSEGRMLQLARVRSLDDLDRGVVANPERAA